MVILALGVSGPAAAADAVSPEGTFVVIGSALVRGTAVEAAREEAIAGALVSIMDRAAAEMLPLETLVTEFETLNANVLENTDRFIQRYKVLNETKTGQHYRVMVEAEVLVAALKDQISRLGLQQTSGNLPRLLFFVTETAADRREPAPDPAEGFEFQPGAAERAMADALQGRGFGIVAHTFDADTAPALAVGEYRPDLELSKALALAGLLDAEVAVMGQAEIRQAAGVAEDGSSGTRAVVSVRAYSVASGREMATASASAGALNAATALSQAGERAGRDLAARLPQAWQKEAARPEALAVVVGGTRNLKNFIQFRQMLNELPGVKEVSTREMKADETTLIVAYQGDARELADALMLKTFDAFGISIFDVSRDRLHVRLISQ